MRTGAYGAICVIIALTASILGGYLLNADTVTDCETEFTYVTDIAGAFEGSSGDVEMDYNPAANVTGWSTSSTYNEGYMTGVNFVPASPNSYFIYGDGDGPSSSETDTITIQSFEENGVSRWQAVSDLKGVIVDDLDCSTMRVAEPGAVSPANQLRLIYLFNLRDVMVGYGYSDYETLGLSMDIAFPGEWPGIVFDSGFHYVWKTSHHPAYYTYDGDPVEEATVYGASSVLTIGESNEALSEIRVGFSGSFTMDVLARISAVSSYVDPTYGIRADGDSSVYWNNNQRNISTEMVLTSFDLENVSVAHTWAMMELHSESQTFKLMVEQTNGSWRVCQYSGDPENELIGILQTADVGTWPAVSVTIANGDVVVRPISNFKDFDSYDLIDVPTVLEWDVLGGEDLVYFKVAKSTNWNADYAMRMQVMNTKVRIVEGGLYLQDGTFDMASGFPGLGAFRLTLGSAAHVGDSVTISGSLGTATIPVTENGRFVVDGEEILFGSCSIMWVSPSYPTQTIEDVAYPAALYHKGQGYEAGTAWLSTPNGYVELGSIGESPVVTLDGLWAPAVNFYTGSNEASSHTEFVDFTDGSFKWDKSQLLLVLMGLSIAMGLAGSYFGYSRVVDWVIIIAVNVGAWMLL